MKARKLLSSFVILSMAFAISASLLFAGTALARPTGVVMSISGPSAGDINVGDDDAVLMNIIMTSDMDITFKNFPISLTASESNPGQGLVRGTLANFEDVKIVNTDTGDVICGPVDSDSFLANPRTGAPVREFNDSREAHYLFGDDFEIGAGEVLHLAITVDVASDTALDGMTISATAEVNSAVPEMRDSDTNMRLPNSMFLIPYTDLQGYTMTVVTP